MINVKPYDKYTFIEQLKDKRLKDFTRIFIKINNTWQHTSHKEYNNYLYSNKGITNFDLNDIRWFGISSKVNITD